MANEIVVQEPREETKSVSTREEDLVSFIVGTIEPWEDYRNDNFEKQWKEIYKEWKAIWTESSKTRESERSKFISPALGQAIEMAVAEQEEATFSKKYWFDMDDDLADQIKKDIEPLRNQLLEDFTLAKIPKAISEIYLNGALYGTGIGKVVVSEIEEEVPGPDGSPVTRPRIEVGLEPVHPENFAIDPAARNINEGHGCAHIVLRPKVDILQKQDRGIYADVDLGSYTDEEDVTAKGESRSNIVGDRVEIIEYHGLVPTNLLIEPEGELDELLTEELGAFDMTEAIVTIANRGALLKAVPNPFTYRDRSIVAYQHDTVPNRFWGRGVGEKGLHSQRGLNAELRARQDGLALTIHPMMAVDSTKIPRGSKFQVGPGKTIFTTGDPRAALMPMHFGDMSSHTYHEASEFERMLQMATGSMDSAAPVGISPRNQTASGMSMIGAGAIKRSKRTMRNIEEDFLKPLINKATWRYQQFDPDRYPFGDYKLLPYSTMGIMAREMEQASIAQVMLAMPDGPAKGVLLKGFIENSSIANTAELEQALAATFNPPQDPMVEEIKRLQLVQEHIKTQQLKADVGKTVSETAENYASIQQKGMQVDINRYNAIDQTQTDERDRIAFGKKPRGAE